MGEPQQAPEEKNIDAAAAEDDEDSDALDALLTQWLEPSLADAAAEYDANDVVVHVRPEPAASANDTEEEEEAEEEAPAAKTLLQVEKDDDVVVAVKTPVVISTLPSGNPSPSAFSTAASAIHENGAEEEEEEESETTTLARWMETEIAAPLRFNANLTREMHAYVMHTLAESQRRTEFLIAENNLLRSRQEERQRLAAEFAHQQQQMGAQGIETVITQQQQLLMQQHAILRSLKAFAVSFEIGGGQRRHQPPPAL